MECLKRMQKILRKPETMVLLAWSMTIIVSVLCVLGAGGWHGERITIPYAVQAYFVSLMVILASIASALALGLNALGLKNFLIALLLALPGGLFMYLALGEMFVYAIFVNETPVQASMLFFFFMVTGGPSWIRSFKDEETRRKIYRGALLLMVPLVLLAAIAFLLLSLIV